MMTQQGTPVPALERSRNKLVAKTFYRQLRSEGFSHEQILELSTLLLDLVTDDLRGPRDRDPQGTGDLPR